MGAAASALPPVSAGGSPADAAGTTAGDATALGGGADLGAVLTQLTKTIEALQQALGGNSALTPPGAPPVTGGGMGGPEAKGGKHGKKGKKADKSPEQAGPEKGKGPDKGKGPKGGGGAPAVGAAPPPPGSTDAGAHMH